MKNKVGLKDFIRKNMKAVIAIAVVIIAVVAAVIVLVVYEAVSYTHLTLPTTPYV